MLDSPEMRRMFSKPTWGFVPEDIDDEGKSWVECQDAIKARTENRLSEAARTAIINDFKKLKAQVYTSYTFVNVFMHVVLSITVHRVRGWVKRSRKRNRYIMLISLLLLRRDVQELNSYVHHRCHLCLLR